MSEVTQLLQRARDGDGSAWDQVVAIIYDDLRRIARGVLHGPGSATLDATGLVHECYLRLSRAGPEGVINRQHFLALAAKAMRQLMLNHARDRLAAKRGGGAQQVTLDDNDLAADAQAEHLVMLDSALQRLADEDERLAKAVECRVFAGLSEQETADAMEMPLRSSQRLFAEARQRLAQILGDAGAGG
ncbi:MAG TPA: ECF-type sigma factor [Aquimonas sp.]|jgi:RNA polymerase sigma factor (TIGR02999 family)|nr:hypothetical protein [Xanthomonadales bacterium]HRD73323.1 ECF-type sigma factor [Aquimonas sp.]HRF53417.1 ECF-type sigma factor [Aquimonas sp.]